MIQPVYQGSIPSCFQPLSEEKNEKRSLLSEVISQVLFESKESSSLSALCQRKEFIILCEQMDNVQGVISDVVIQALLRSDCKGQSKEAKELAKKRRGFFDLLIKEVKNQLSSVAPIKKTSGGAAEIEGLILGHKKGPCAKIHKEVKKFFSHIGTGKDVLNLLSLSGTCVYYIFRADVLREISSKIQELEKAQQELPEDAHHLREEMQEQLSILTDFLKVEKKLFTKEVGSEIQKSVPRILDLLLFGLDLAEQACEGSEAADHIGVASIALDQIVSVFKLIKSGKGLYDVMKTFQAYTKWKEVLQHKIDRIESSPSLEKLTKRKALIDSTMQRMGEEFHLDEWVQNPPAVEDRGVEMQKLKKEMKEFLTVQLKERRVSQAEGEAEILSHIRVRKLNHDLAVKECGSVEAACKKEMLTSSIKNGLHNLALMKCALEKSLYKAQAVFTSIDNVFAIIGVVTAFLGLFALLCPPISTLISLSLLIGGSLLFAAEMLHQFNNRPHVFKETWFSLDRWTSIGWGLQSKYYTWRLERKLREVSALEQTLAPTCFKIALLEGILKKDIPGKPGLLFQLGVDFSADSESMTKAIQGKVEKLRASLSEKDTKRLKTLKERIRNLTYQEKDVSKKLKRIDERLRKAYLKDNLAEMRKNQGWKHIESLLKTFQEGIGERLVAGDGLSLSILQEVCDEMGISFDLEKIGAVLMKKEVMRGTQEKLFIAESEVKTLEKSYKEALAQKNDSMAKIAQKKLQCAEERRVQAYEEKKASFKTLLEELEKPLHRFLSRAEGSFKGIAALQGA